MSTKLEGSNSHVGCDHDNSTNLLLYIPFIQTYHQGRDTRTCIYMYICDEREGGREGGDHVCTCCVASPFQYLGV